MLLLARLYRVGEVMFLSGFVFLFFLMYVVISLFYFLQKCMFQLYCLLLTVTRYIISRYICFRLDKCCSRLECLLWQDCVVGRNMSVVVRCMCC